MKFACPHCAQRLEAELHMAGQQIACPVCAQTITIPGAEILNPQGSAPSDTRNPAASPLPLEPINRARLGWKLLVPGAVLLVAVAYLLFALATRRGASLADLRVFPAEVRLKTKQDRQSLVVQAVYADGSTRDVTDKASISFGSKGIASISAEAGVRRAIAPLADGKTDLRITFRGRILSVPVIVEQAQLERPISFRTDVMPVFTKAGCNAGACHGASRGKDGFHLSLFGYDPDGDYYRLTQENVGRRINLAIPEESLVIEKALGLVPHTGGERFKKDSELYHTLVRWLRAGAPKDGTNVAKVVGLEIMPTQAVLEGRDSTQRLAVRAKYSDGTDRDVTSLASFISNNEPVAKVSEQGLVTAGQRGESFIMARFDTFNVGAQFIVVPKDLPYTFPAEITDYNYIDTLVHAKLKKLRIAPADVCDDATFIRRATVDIVGRLPTVEEVKTFVDEPSANKRAQRVDQLLERKEFAELWVMKWAELLQVRSRNNQFSPKSARLYYEWLQEQLALNVPINRIVQDLITASGSTFKNPAANYYQVQTDTLKTAENVAQVFMGMRIQCAQCHNHPFDRWTMNDYYSFAAFFPQVARKQGEDPRENIVYDKTEGDVKHPVGGRVMAPKFLGGEPPEIKDKSRREVLAKWLASPENPYFARNIANIIWAHFLGKGIIDPVDDVRISNPPVNPELLEALGAKFTEYNYDFKKLVRGICTSRTYQLSTRTSVRKADNQVPTRKADTFARLTSIFSRSTDTPVHDASSVLDDRNFARASIRRIRAEVLLDCISQVTETKDKFPGLPRGSRAVEIADGAYNNFFLTTFGRATRETVCSCEVKTEPNLSQALHLLNGNTVQNKIDEGGVVKKMLKAGKSPQEIIEELYLRCLARKPTQAELAKIGSFMTNDPKENERALTDLFWSLLNAKEFIFNH